ncbi:nuclear envelope pore membrane protein POM 121 [Genypterus blacodes]|uniref:nuclear envelope pore membrane protein POM 121 n=1 Tax=Genypterus blacodes TaxID=154954 RepID=UPI003F76B3DC
MLPRERHLVLLSALGVFSLAVYCIPNFIYATLIVAICYILCYFRVGQQLVARLGLNPRVGLNVSAVLRRMLWLRREPGVSVSQAGRTRTLNKSEARNSEGLYRQKLCNIGVYRREHLERDSFLFSPRDFLMGSYIGKPESPIADSWRPKAGKNPQEQLREKLSRPNHAVYTPNRRLSFTGEPLGTVGRFTITPQRHYPLQQPGVSSVGVLPLVQWDGFRKKNLLSPRKSSAVLSPVTVKIARPNHSPPSLHYQSCGGLPRAPADPCSRESVLKVLKESRKREVEDEDRSFTAEQKNKRRRNDSGGSAHSAFEPLLPNGTPSQLVPKPGTLKRGMSSVVEESIMKRSRTSSISSGNGLHAPRGIPGNMRNPIHSSYSSSQGLNQWKRASVPSSPLSSLESSRSQTPEGACKRPREDDHQSPSSASSVTSDLTASDKAPVTSKVTPVPRIPLTPSHCTGSGGKRKRKIQLVSSHRNDHICLPPPPELGYTITVKDLDEEKKDAFNKIQKVLEEPAPEPEKSISPPTITFTQTPLTVTSSTTTLSSLLTSPLPTPSSSTNTVINLEPSPASSVKTQPAAPNPLLEILKAKLNTSASSTPAANSSTVLASTTPAQSSGSVIKPPVAADAPQPPTASQPQSTSASVDHPSAFMQVLGQASKIPNSTSTIAGVGLFGQASQISAPAALSNSNTVSTAVHTVSSSSSNPLLASGFKPIFAVTTMTPSSSSSATSGPETKPVQSFKPIFGGTSAVTGFGQSPSLPVTALAPTVSSNDTSSIFGQLSSSTKVTTSIFPGPSNLPPGTASTGSITAAQPAAKTTAKTLFGDWSTPVTMSTSLNPARAPATGSTFQFGGGTTITTVAAAASPATVSTSNNTTFAFGGTQSDPTNAPQKAYTFSQATPSQNTATSSFGGFASANTTSTAAVTATQSTFSFGKPAFEAPAAQSAFSSPAASLKPFPFAGSGTSSSTPAPASAPFTFGAAAAAATTASSFGTPIKAAFGASSTGFAFGGTTAPSAVPNFGATTQTQSNASSSFAFGGAAPQQTPSGPTQQASSGFNFGAAISGTQFGTPLPNNPAPQMGAFNFGNAPTDKPAFGTSTPAFGQSNAAAGPIPFGSPGTPVQGFGAAPFGSPATPSFSIGAGSKPSGARQRLQARRQHNRKK